MLVSIACRRVYGSFIVASTSQQQRQQYPYKRLKTTISIIQVFFLFQIQKACLAHFRHLHRFSSRAAFGFFGNALSGRRLLCHINLISIVIKHSMAFGLSFTQKKWLIILTLVLLNGSLIALSIVFDRTWVKTLISIIFLIQVFYSTLEIILIVVFYLYKRLSKAIFKTEEIDIVQLTEGKTLAMMIPCYNETQQEVMTTIDAYLAQQDIQHMKKLLIIVVDGKIPIKIKGQVGVVEVGAVDASPTGLIGNNPNNGNSQKIINSNAQIISQQIGVITTTTAQIVLNGILSCLSTKNIRKAYMSWKKTFINIEVSDGTFKGLPYLVIVKSENCTKRDSLALVYKLIYSLQKEEEINPNEYSQELIDYVQGVFVKFGIKKIDYLMCTDGDSEPLPKAAIRMVTEVERKQDIMGTTGQIQVRFESYLSLLELYQFVEYISGQAIGRLQQTLTSQKVHCLSGALNLIKVRKETCGEAVLKQYRFRSQTQSLMEYIKNSASEDRHHIMVMMGLYPYAKTTMTFDAVCRTGVPINYMHFLSQRKRWNLGTVTHNIWMTFIIPQIRFYERISSFMVILQFVFLPLHIYAYFYFISVLIKIKGITSILYIVLLALSVLRLLYEFLIGCFTPELPAKQRFIYILMVIPYIFILNQVRSLACWIYNLYHIDDFNWIKGNNLKTHSQAQSPAAMVTSTSKDDLTN